MIGNAIHEVYGDSRDGQSSSSNFNVTHLETPTGRVEGSEYNGSR